MNNIKRLSLALVALGLSAPAFAADCYSSKVLVPSQHGGLKVGIDALYLRPTSSDLGYATTITFPSAFSLGFERNASVDPSYDWGVYAQVGYLFPCTGNDLTLGYTHLNTNDTDSVIAPPLTIIEGGEGDIAVSNGSISVLPMSAFADGRTFAAAQGKSEFTLNVVDLEAGQRFTTGSYDMRMFAGLRYANIDTSLKAFAQHFIVPSGVTPIGINSSFSGEQEFQSQFRGVGPRIGVDGRYCLRSGFGLDANLSTSLLVGSLDSKYNTTLTDITVVEDFAVKKGCNTRVVPVLEAKLGADYTYIMDCRCKSALVFEAGYQATNYFNVSEHPTVLDTIQQSTPVGRLAAAGNTSDVAFSGPYLGVKYYA